MYLRNGDEIKVRVLTGARGLSRLHGLIVNGIVQREWNGANMIEFKMDGDNKVYYVDDEWFTLIKANPTQPEEPSCL